MLVARILLAGDRHAFAQLMRRHQARVRSQLRRLVRGDEAKADDLAQETFLLAWRNLHRFRGEAQFSTWLYRIAYSCFLQDRRRAKSPLEEEEGDVPDMSTGLAEQAELRVDVERAMRSLSRDEQVVLMHVVQLGLSHDEASYVLEMPLGTVKSHARRGKEKLRNLLADWIKTDRKGEA